MRTMLASHIKISKLGIGWFAALITPSGEGHNRVEILGRSDSMEDIVEDCMLNCSFDRTIKWLRETRKQK
jgi:hypothetical protein